MRVVGRTPPPAFHDAKHPRFSGLEKITTTTCFFSHFLFGGKNRPKINQNIHIFQCEAWRKFVFGSQGVDGKGVLPDGRGVWTPPLDKSNAMDCGGDSRWTKIKDCLTTTSPPLVEDEHWPFIDPQVGDGG